MRNNGELQGIHNTHAQNSAGTALEAETHVDDTPTRRTAEAMLQRGRAATEVTRQGTQAGVETMRRASKAATETVRRTTQVVAESQRQIAQDAAQTFQEVNRQMAQVAHSTSEDLRQLATLPYAAEGGMRDVRQGIAGLIEGVMQTNLRATQELFRLANPSAMVELQQRFARNYMDTVTQGTATLVRAIRRAVDETLSPLEAQIEQRQQAR